MQGISTGTVAKMFGVCDATVRRWVRTGMLQSYILPGTRHRRFRESVIKAFAEKHGVSLVEPTAH